VGLNGWTFHSLRHFFITELCRRGAPTMVVKQLAGHAELSTTQRYAHMVASDLGAAIALFGRSKTQ
jgi:site-specific recombinase XerD